MSEKVLLNTIIATAITLSTITFTTTAFAATEKCYGISKAHKNDCRANACSGTATKDRQGDTYLNVPKGLCTKIVGGSLKPIK